jgi:hypothetical protein
MPLAAPGPEWSTEQAEEGPGNVVPIPGPEPLFSLIPDDGPNRRPVPAHLLPCDCVVGGSEATEIRRLIQEARATLARAGKVVT